MKPSQALDTHRAAIRRIIEAHRASNARIFGSVAHGNDTEVSDLDILIDPTPETTLFDIGAIRHKLLQLLGVPVDAVTPKALPEKFRRTVLAEGGTLILAGLLAGQGETVAQAYRRQGLRLVHRADRGDWPTLTLAKRVRYGTERVTRLSRGKGEAPGFGSW